MNHWRLLMLLAYGFILPSSTKQKPRSSDYFVRLFVYSFKLRRLLDPTKVLFDKVFIENNGVE